MLMVPEDWMNATNMSMCTCVFATSSLPYLFHYQLPICSQGGQEGAICIQAEFIQGSAHTIGLQTSNMK
eukprot:1141041-Pelagomonas_calceolata.AAC.12